MSGGRGHFSGLETGHRKCMSEKYTQYDFEDQGAMVIMPLPPCIDPTELETEVQSVCLVFNKMPGLDSNAMRIMKN